MRKLRRLYPASAGAWAQVRERDDMEGGLEGDLENMIDTAPDGTMDRGHPFDGRTCVWIVTVLSSEVRGGSDQRAMSIRCNLDISAPCNAREHCSSIARTGANRGRG
jgi:hypothetical protein